MRKHLDTAILAALTVITSVLAVVMYFMGNASWLEAASFVTGALCVWLTVKENVWNFPISLVNVTTFCFVFFHSSLYADASLQVIYFVLTLIGWYLWLYGGAKRTALHIQRTGIYETTATFVAMAIIAAVYWRILRAVPGTTPIWDASTTAISLGAQWLLNRKRLENWVLWITADLIYVPLYLYKGLYLTSILYAVFLIMAIMGLFQWRARWRQQAANSPAPAPAEVAT